MLYSIPERTHSGSAWNEHVPFAMLLAELQQPRVLVELGTQWGVSYCAWCQAIKALGLSTRCYAVDTWVGDEHAGEYGDEVFKDLKIYQKKYESFSSMLRMTFDEALLKIPDRSVDLLHIDGLHTYEAVKHDYSTWLPKMSECGVVLFHDTNVFERGFGVHLLWAELAAKYPSFNFEHGYGLGVLAVGKYVPQPVLGFLESANASPKGVRGFFEALGRRIQAEVELEKTIKKLKEQSESREYKLGVKVFSALRKAKKLTKN